MASRTISILVNIDLAKGSKEAHAVTIKKIADAIGAQAVEAIEAKGYTVRAAHVETVLHYVRHEMRTQLKKAVVRKLKKVS